MTARVDTQVARPFPTRTNNPDTRSAGTAMLAILPLPIGQTIGEFPRLSRVGAGSKPKKTD